MNFQDALVKIVFQGVDRMSPLLRGIESRAGGLERSLKRLDTVGGAMSRFGGKLLTAGGLGAGFGLGAMIREAADAESALAQLANIADLTPAQTKVMGASVLNMSKRVGQSQMEILAGVQTLMGAGMERAGAMEATLHIGKVATAYGADMNEMARTAYASFSNLKVPVGQTAKLFDVLAQAGKEGNFELKDMSKELPSIAASASMLGSSGIRGVSQIGAALQIARRGAGDSSEAANNFQNFLMKIDSPETKRKFRKLGINWEKEMAGFRSSDDVFGAVGDRLAELAAKGLKIGDVFEDQQVRKFLNIFTKNMGDYKKIRDDAFNSSGVVDKDFGRVNKTFNQSFKNLKNSFTALVMPKVIPWMDKLTGFMDRMSKDPKAFDRLLSLGKGLLLAGVGFKVLGGGLQFLGSDFVRNGLLSGSFARSLQGVSGAMGPLEKGLPGLASALGPLAPRLFGFGVAGVAAAVGIGLLASQSDKIQPQLDSLKASAGSLKDDFGKLGDLFSVEMGAGSDRLGAMAFTADVLARAVGLVAGGLETVLGLLYGIGSTVREVILGPLEASFAAMDAWGGVRDSGGGMMDAMKAANSAYKGRIGQTWDRMGAGWSTAGDMLMGGANTAGNAMSRHPETATGPAPEWVRGKHAQARLDSWQVGRKAAREAPLFTGGINISLSSAADDETILKKVHEALKKARADADRRSLRTGPDSSPYAMGAAH